ncbi:MAG: dockerin type I repeat-containing protein [Bacteroidaceae bacterium]|nr:dockerin type I repeat-containing protein [Bacteroidaceae bacterium]
MRRKLLNLCLTMLMSVVSTAAWALSESGGAYQIGTAADLEEFAVLVNGGEVFANAVLTADIDRGIDGTLIGTAENKYQGFFDGKGHTITINLFSAGANNVALFRETGWGSVIQNLKVQGTITTSTQFAAGLVGENRSVIRNCYIDVTINTAVAGDGTHGGLVGRSYAGTIIEDCLVKVAMKGETTNSCGGVAGWAAGRVSIMNCLVVSDGSTIDLKNGASRNISRCDSNVKGLDVETYNSDTYANRPNGLCANNYVTNEWSSTNPASTVVPLEDLADGRICYQLNTDQSNIAWAQEIGVDPFPVPAIFGGKQVYASAATGCDGKSEGELTFSNSGTVQATAHQYDKYGICTVCGSFNTGYFDIDNTAKFDQAGRAILLKSVEDIDMAEGVNRISGGLGLNMKLDADIEYIAEPTHYIFNNDDSGIRGNFDGQGHTLTYQMSEMGGRASIFPVMYGNVENLILHGSIGTVSGQNAGSVAGRACMALVRNVYSDVNIISDINDDNSSGGFFGWMGEVEKHVENCIYAGNFTTPRNPDSGAGCVRIGGFSGWAASKTYFTNCAFLGNLVGAGGSGYIENSQHISRNPDNVVCENVYVANIIEGPDVTDTEKINQIEDLDDIENGALAFALNGNQGGVERFYQRIGTDLEPMPFKKEGGLVYLASGTYRCDGTPLGGASYTNSPSGEPVIPPHEFEDGWCTVCGQLDENFLVPEDGWLEVTNGAELKWWSNYATLHPDASVRLLEDIDMDGYMDGYVPVTLFTGTFDGQGHTISNFIIDNTSSNQGLIGTVADGVVVQNLILDETCSIQAGGYAGIIGNTSGTGTIYVTNVGFEGEVGVNGYNAAGLVGCCNGGSMNMIITNCWVTGTITKGQQSGAICGYSGSGSVVKDCWSTCQMQSSAIYSSDSFTRGSAQVINCYEADIEGVAQNKQQHYNPTAANRKTITLPLEEVASGALCYNLNGKQFVEPTWFQTIDDDEHPYPFGDNHNIIIYGAEQYFSVEGEEDVPDVASEILNYEADRFEETIATQSLIDEYDAAVAALEDVATFADLAAAIDAINAAKKAVEANAAIYQAYIDKCEEVKAYLASHDDFEGALRTALENYLAQNEEPDDENTFGTYEYIVENHTATADEIKAETDRITQWLADAITNGYVAGTDVSSLIPNSDFSKEKENWTGGFSNGYGTIQNAEGLAVRGVEAWNVTGDQYQTVEGMKPGYYLVGINGAFRPSNDRYSYNYAAGIYANGIFNYFPTIIEDYVPVEEAQDGVNCNLTIKSAYDFPIYDDFLSTSDESGAELIGYAVQGETGMACAANAGRYPAYTIAKVGEDGKLTVGIKNPGTHYGNDWTGWGALKVVYYGEEADKVSAALDQVLENMTARASVILDPQKYIFDEDNAAIAPNFPEALKTELADAVVAAAAAETNEAKEAAIAKYSELFQAIYEGKQAYIALFNATKALEGMSFANMNLAEKDEETGEWFKTEETLFGEEETKVLEDAWLDLFDVYYNGSYSAEEALEVANLNIPSLAGLVPAKDEDGYYLISTPKEFAMYHAIASEVDRYAKGKLTADVDMAGIAMLPIGHNRGENAQHIFAGVFDGQGHALTNVYIDDANWDNQGYAEPATLFYELQNATVKNLKLTGDYHTMHQNMGGVTRYMSGASTIDNCDISVVLRSGINGDGTHGGVVGYCGSSSSVVKNCLVNNLMMSDEGVVTLHVGGVCGWGGQALQVKNTLILSQYENIGLVDAGDVNSSSVCRNQSSLENVFISSVFRVQQGTLVTAEQLASGEIAWKLNGQSGEEPFWYQTLGTDATPHLFGDDVVYYYNGEYTNDKPNPQLNAFAYNLEANLAGDKVVVSFDLNAEAESAEVRFSNGYTQAVEEELKAGSYSVTVPASNLGSDPTALSYEVAVTGKGTLETVKVGKSYIVWGPYGMAVNNNPKSKGFGQLLLAESWVQEYKNGDKVYHTGDKVGALFAFDASFQPINAADGTPGFYGGLDIANETPLEMVDNYCFDLLDLQFSKDGRLFAARAAGQDGSSVYEINPDDLNEPWKPLFKGGELDEETGITYVGEDEQNRLAISLALEGEGENLKMYVLGGQRSNGQSNSTDYNCAFYNLGTATEWTDVPSGYVEALDGVYTTSPYQVGICADGNGGLWYLQRTTPSEETPSIMHFNADGSEDYKDISNQIGGGRMAITPDGQYIAIPTGLNTIVLYETNYVPMANGRIFLNPKQTIRVTESSIGSMAFDYAGNLYVASGGTETLSRYALPRDNKVVVTPGNGISLGINGDTNSDGTVDIADVVAILNAMAVDATDAKFDVNNDGTIDIADVVAVLNIMAQQ